VKRCALCNSSELKLEILNGHPLSIDLDQQVKVSGKGVTKTTCANKAHEYINFKKLEQLFAIVAYCVATGDEKDWNDKDKIFLKKWLLSTESVGEETDGSQYLKRLKSYVEDRLEKRFLCSTGHLSFVWDRSTALNIQFCDDMGGSWEPVVPANAMH
jgi:hypothetical protein